MCPIERKEKRKWRATTRSPRVHPAYLCKLIDPENKRLRVHTELLRQSKLALIASQHTKHATPQTQQLHRPLSSARYISQSQVLCSVDTRHRSRKCQYSGATKLPEVHLQQPQRNHACRLFGLFRSCHAASRYSSTDISVGEGGTRSMRNRTLGGNPKAGKLPRRQSGPQYRTR